MFPRLQIPEVTLYLGITEDPETHNAKDLVGIPRGEA